MGIQAELVTYENDNRRLPKHHMTCRRLYIDISVLTYQ